MATRMNIRIIAAGAAVAIAALASYAFVGRAAAPDVRFATLTGKAVSTSDLRAKVVLVNFWATWTVGIAVRGERPDAVAQFLERRGVPYTVALDASGEVAQRFGGVRVTPLSVLIDRQGRIVARYVGEPDWSELHSAIERLL